VASATERDGRTWLVRGLLILFLVVVPASVFVVHFRGCWPPPPAVDITALTARSAPLVAALERYTEEHGAAPSKPTALLPDYIAAIPASGFREHPELGYLTWVDPSDNKLHWQLHASLDGVVPYQNSTLYLNPK
jgi:hypothetical protein